MDKRGRFTIKRQKVISITETNKLGQDAVNAVHEFRQEQDMLDQMTGREREIAVAKRFEEVFKCLPTRIEKSSIWYDDLEIGFSVSYSDKSNLSIKFYLYRSCPQCERIIIFREIQNLIFDLDNELSPRQYHECKKIDVLELKTKNILDRLFGWISDYI